MKILNPNISTDKSATRKKCAKINKTTVINDVPHERSAAGAINTRPLITIINARWLNESENSL